MRLAFVKSGPVADELLRLDGVWKNNSIELIWDMAKLAEQHSVWIGAVCRTAQNRCTSRTNCQAICWPIGTGSLSKRRLKELLYKLLLLWNVLKFRPDMLFFFEQSLLPLKLLLARMFRIEPVICFAREDQLNSRACRWFKLFRVHYFTAPAPYFAEKLKSAGIAQTFLLRLPHYPREFFEALPSESEFPGFDFSFLYVGRLEAAKGVRELLDAFKRIADTIPHAGLNLVGQGTLEPEIRSFIAKNKLAKQIRLWGSKTNIEVGSYLRGSDVLVFPSYSEGFAKVWYEAMLIGIPLITTPLQGIRKILQDEDSVLYVPVKDSPALAAAMLRLARNRDLRIHMSEAIRHVPETRLHCDGNFQRCVELVCEYKSLSVSIPKVGH